MVLLLCPFNPASFADHTATSLFFRFPILISFSSHILHLSYLTPTATHQARMELRRLKQEARNKLAVTVIWAYWQGTKVFPRSRSVSLSQLSCHACPPCPIPFPL